MINNLLLGICLVELVTLSSKDVLFAVSKGLGIGQNNGLLWLTEMSPLEILSRHGECGDGDNPKVKNYDRRFPNN